MKLRCGCLLAAVLVWSGCGGAERREATSLLQVLDQKKAELAGINGLEKDLLGSVRAWSEGIIAKGGGAGKELQENAAAAKGLSDAASIVATQLSQFRQTLSSQPLKEEFPQSVRSTLMNQIMKRQKMLQELRMALQGSADGFLEFGRSRSYHGDTYPAGIDKLNSMLSTYRGPEDAVSKAMQDLRVKYTIEDADLKGKT